MDRLWGPHTINRFSSQRTVLVTTRRFNSRFWQLSEVGCEGVDAFAQDWKGEMNWVHAPYRLIGLVVGHMLHCGAKGTLVVPFWERAPWWPLLRKGSGWAWFVKDAMPLGDSVGVFAGLRKPGALVVGTNSQAELAELPVGKLWALHVDFSFVCDSRCEALAAGSSSQRGPAGGAGGAITKEAAGGARAHAASAGKAQAAAGTKEAFRGRTRGRR